VRVRACVVVVVGKVLILLFYTLCLPCSFHNLRQANLEDGPQKHGAEDSIAAAGSCAPRRRQGGCLGSLPNLSSKCWFGKNEWEEE